MGLTTDPNDPRLTHGTDSEPVPQAEVYLVLSDEEIRKGFVRPLRHAYKHVGIPGPKYEIRDLTEEEQERWGGPPNNWVKYEPYPESESPVTGSGWTQERLDKIGKGCGHVTTMNLSIAETYARDPKFYGATYCVACGKHLPVLEFIWVDPVTGRDLPDERVGS